MFVLPRKLNSGDKIGVSGEFRGNPQRLVVSLTAGQGAPDAREVACRLDVQFAQDRILLQVTHDGYTEHVAGDYQNFSVSDWFSGNNFYFRFELSVSANDGSHSINISIGDNHLEDLQLKHGIEDIRFLTLEGDIEKVGRLDFEFA